MLDTLQDEENCRMLLEQPGSEVVLLQMGSMLQLAAMQETVALDAAWSAVEALFYMTRFPEGTRQLLARGSLPGRPRTDLSNSLTKVMATRPPEEVVAAMMRDLLSGLAALVNAPEPSLLKMSTGLMKNLTSHELVRDPGYVEAIQCLFPDSSMFIWERLRSEPDDSLGTLVSGLVLAMCLPDMFTVDDGAKASGYIARASLAASTTLATRLRETSAWTARSSLDNVPIHVSSSRSRHLLALKGARAESADLLPRGIFQGPLSRTLAETTWAGEATTARWGSRPRVMQRRRSTSCLTTPRLSPAY
eukprot:1187541-Prorocentrum_minimum.AAC.2